MSTPRQILGVVAACILAVSCSASDSAAPLTLAPASYQTAASSELGMTPDVPELEMAASAVHPSPRPGSDGETQVEALSTQAAQAPVSETAAEAPVQTATEDAAAQEDEQIAQTEAPAEGVGPAPQTRGLFSALFTSAPKEPTQAEAESISPNEPVEEAKLASAEPAAQPQQETAAEAQPEPVQAAEEEEKPAALPQDEQVAAASSTAATESPNADPAAPKKRGFLSAFFAPAEKPAPFPAPEAEKAAEPEVVVSEEKTEEPEKAEITLASVSSPAQANLAGLDVLPGVRGREQLFEIRSKSELSDDSNLDLYEEEDGSYQVASAAGLARLAPNGLLKQRESIDVSCFKPQLMRVLRTIESHYGKRILVTSGYRSPSHNKRVRGARNSMHMYCAAADIQIEGVSKWELARFARSLPGRGGVGTYCHTNSVHVDVGPERDWNWRCRRS